MLLLSLIDLYSKFIFSVLHDISPVLLQEIDFN